MSAGEILTLVVAAIGAITGLIALGWQVYTWRKRRTPNISVEVRHRGPWGRMMVTTSKSPTPPEGHMPVASEYELVLIVLNRGETTEIIESIVLERPMMPGTRPEPPLWFNERLDTLTPGSAIKHVVPVSGLHGVGDPSGLEFVVYVGTVSGVMVQSRELIEPEWVRLSRLNQPLRWWRRRGRLVRGVPLVAFAVIAWRRAVRSR
jgi:hypothetical protein